MTNIKKMRLLFIFSLLCVTISSFGQNWYYDYERKGYPDIVIWHADSITSVNVYRSEAYSPLLRKIPTLKGDLLYHVILNDKYQTTEIIKYYPGSGEVGAKYIFDYFPDTQVRISMLKANGKIRHSWVLKKGMLLEEISYGARQAVTDKWTYQYIRDSLLEKVTKLDKINKEVYRLNYRYDSLYRLAELKEYKEDSLVLISKYFYDSIGRIKGLWFYPFNTPVWNFGKKNLVMSEIITNEKNIAYNYVNYQYGDNNRLLKKTTLRNDSLVNSYMTYTYEPDGKPKEITEFNKRDIPIFKQVYKYNNSGREIGYTEYSRVIGKLIEPVYDMKIVENMRGNIKRIEINNRHKPDTELYTYEYK